MVDTLQKAKAGITDFLFSITQNMDFELATKNNPVDLEGKIHAGKHEILNLYRKTGQFIKNRIGYVILYPITDKDKAITTKLETPIENALREFISTRIVGYNVPAQSETTPTPQNAPPAIQTQAINPIVSQDEKTLLKYATYDSDGRILKIEPKNFPISMQDDPNKYADKRLRVNQDIYYQLQSDVIKAVGGNKQIGNIVFDILYTGEPRREDNLRGQLSNLNFGGESAINFYWKGYDNFAQWLINGGQYGITLVNRQEYDPTAIAGKISLNVPV